MSRLAVLKPLGRMARWLAMQGRRRYQRITVRLDGVQLAWVDGLAELHKCSRAAVVRESIRYFAARESARMARTRRYQLIGLVARSERWDPVGDYLNEKGLAG